MLDTTMHKFDKKTLMFIMRGKISPAVIGAGDRSLQTIGFQMTWAVSCRYFLRGPPLPFCRPVPNYTA